MTIVRVVYLSCDGCNVATCEAGCPHDSGVEAREVHGWTRRGKRDLCPDCAEPTVRCPGCDCEPVGYAPHNGQGDCPPVPTPTTKEPTDG